MYKWVRASEKLYYITYLCFPLLLGLNYLAWSSLTLVDCFCQIVPGGERKKIHNYMYVTCWWLSWFINLGKDQQRRWITKSTTKVNSKWMATSTHSNNTNRDWFSAEWEAMSNENKRSISIQLTPLSVGDAGPWLRSGVGGVRRRRVVGALL